MISYVDVKSRCQVLSTVQLASIARSLLGRDATPAEEDELSAGEALLIWLADLLEWMQICSQDQRTLLLQELRKEILKLGEILQDCEKDTRLPIFHIGFADRRWATCTTLERFFDLDVGEWVEKLEEPPLETVTYACTALFMRNHHAIRSQGRQDDASNSPTE